MAQIYRQQARSRPQAKVSTVTPVVGLDHQGRGIVRSKQGTRFVEGALTGDQIRYQNTGKYTAQLIQLVSPSEHRIEPPCPFYQRCGGCDLQALALPQQRQHKQQVVAELLLKFAQTEPQQWSSPLIGSDYGYRRRTRLAVHWQSKRNELKLGFRARQSKDIIDIPHCMVLEPVLNRLLTPLQQLLSELGLGRWLGHVELYATDTTVVLLRLSNWHRSQLSAAAETRLAEWEQAHAVAIWLQLDQGLPEALRRPAPLPAYQTGFEHHGHREQWHVPFYPGDFIQANAELSEKMVEQALAWLQPQADERILELYAGTGNFSIPIASTGAKLIAVEGVARMVERLQNNLDEAFGDNHSAVAVQADLSLATALSEFTSEPIHKALLDPARAGAEQAIQGLIAAQINRIIYISCAPDTLARDAQYLCQNGYQIKRAQVVDMFPQTHHIETMVWFEREL